MRTLLLTATILAGAAATALPASALVLDLNTCITGDCSGGNVTVATVTITDKVGGGVTFVYENKTSNLSNHNSDTFIDYLLLSYSGSTVLTTALISNFSISGGTEPDSLSDAQVGFSFGNFLDAGYGFQIEFQTPNSNSSGGTHRFKDPEILSWDMALVSEADFAVTVDEDGDPNTPDQPVDISGLVHVASLTGGGSAKYWGFSGGSSSGGSNCTDPNGCVDVPEPATLALLGAGLFGLGLARRRYRF